MIVRRSGGADHDVRGVNVVGAFDAGQRCETHPRSLRCSEREREGEGEGERQ